MKRILVEIDGNKWYHLETLKKFYKGPQVRTKIAKDADGEEYTIVYFLNGWGKTYYIVHPKTKRLKWYYENVLEEPGFNV